MGGKSRGKGENVLKDNVDKRRTADSLLFNLKLSFQPLPHWQSFSCHKLSMTLFEKLLTPIFMAIL